MIMVGTLIAPRCARWSTVPILRVHSMLAYGEDRRNISNTHWPMAGDTGVGSPGNSGRPAARNAGRSFFRAATMLSDLAVSRCRGARAGEQHPRDAPCPVTRQIANDFTTPHRITDQRNIAKVELLDHSGQIAGERVEIAASPGIL